MYRAPHTVSEFHLSILLFSLVTVTKKKITLFLLVQRDYDVISTRSSSWKGNR